jgi:hypothetical protein
VDVSGNFFNHQRVPPRDFSYWQFFTSFGDFLSKMGTSFNLIFWDKFTLWFYKGFVSLRWIYLSGAFLAFWNKKMRPHVLIAAVYSFSFLTMAWIPDYVHYRFFCLFHVFSFLFIGYFIKIAARVTLPDFIWSGMGNEEDSANGRENINNL